jgi:hypothetical protein
VEEYQGKRVAAADSTLRLDIFFEAGVPTLAKAGV